MDTEIFKYCYVLTKFFLYDDKLRLKRNSVFFMCATNAFRNSIDLNVFECFRESLYIGYSIVHSKKFHVSTSYDIGLEYQI